MKEAEVFSDSWVLGCTHVGIPEVSRQISEVRKIEFTLPSLDFHSIAVSNLLGGWASLLIDPLDDGVFCSSPSVVLLGSRSVIRKFRIRTRQRYGEAV